MRPKECRESQVQVIETDLIIIGAGIAGLSAAIEAQKKLKKIVLLCKGDMFACGSTFSNFNNRWGITWAGSEDERKILEEKINRLSLRTNLPELTKIVVEESYGAFEKLLGWGIEFLKEGHSHHFRRVPPCFCRVPLSTIIRSCQQAASAMRKQLDYENIKLLSNSSAEKIMTARGRFSGIIAQKGNTSIKIRARAGILATGGNASTHVRHITEPGLAGDGYRLLEDVGIELHNMNHMQLVWEDISLSGDRFSIRSIGSPDHLFKTSAGETISFDDIGQELIEQRHTHVPISNLQADRKVDELLMKHCSDTKPVYVFRRGSKDPDNIILPHAQACNGGVIIGAHGETPLPGLFAAGEVTTGMHGADRVGGMMITNAIVFGTRAGAAAAEAVH